MLGQPLGAGHVGQPLVENGFEQRVAARNGIADNKRVRLERQLVKLETFNQFDARVAQLVAHRRIDVGVAACNTVAGGDRELGQSAHESSADTQNMNVHVTWSR